MDEQLDVIVVGGGIAGLAAALHLQRSAPGLSVRLLERDTTPGGWIRTSHVDGFTVEAGPDSFLSTKPAGIELCREVGLEDQLEGVDEETRATYVMRNGRLHPLPEGLSGLVPARLGPLFTSSLLSLPGRVRLAAEQLIRARRGDEDESLGAFMRRRFGGEAYERLMEPLMSGIYGGSGDSLSLLATFSQLRRLEREHGSVLRGTKRSSNRTSGPRRSPFVAPVEGMSALPAAVGRKLEPSSVVTGVAVVSVTANSSGYAVELDSSGLLHSRTCILATPAYVAANLVSSLDAELSELLAGIVYGSTATVSLGFPAGEVGIQGLGHGYIIPRAEGRPVMAITFSSRKFRHRAPAGALLARGFIRAAGPGELHSATDAGLIGLVRRELRRTCGIEGKPAVTRVFRMPRSMPQYTVGHPHRLAAIDELLTLHPGLALAGAAYRGVGVPDCITSGRSAADQVIAHLA